MTAQAALHKFYNSFGLPAYPTNLVPDDGVYPYITYEPTVSDLTGQTVYPALNLWYHTSSMATPNAKATAIRKAVRDGVSIKCDDGAIYIFGSQPWQAVPDNNDSDIKHLYTTLTVVFNTL